MSHFFNAPSDKFLDRRSERRQSAGRQLSCSDADLIQSRRKQVGRSQRANDGMIRQLVAFANHLTALESAAGNQTGVALMPVVPAGLAVDFGSAAEFANDHNDGVIDQAAFFQVVKERGRCLVEHPGVSILELLKVAVVHVPSAVAGILDRLDMGAPVDLNEAGTTFNQPPG